MKVSSLKKLRSLAPRFASLRELARLVPIHPATLSHYERGCASKKLVARLAYVYSFWLHVELTAEQFMQLAHGKPVDVMELNASTRSSGEFEFSKKSIRRLHTPCPKCKSDDTIVLRTRGGRRFLKCRCGNAFRTRIQ